MSGDQPLSRLAPPLQAIQAFIAATKAPSFRAAADELAISPSAFSRRISSLEAMLGVALFDRSGAAPRLTEVGKRYSQQLEPAVDAIRAATEGIRDAPKGRRLRLMCPPSVAIGWLMPRLRDYSALCGGQEEVDLVVSRDLDALRLGQADIAIASGPRDYGELLCEPLLRLRGAVVSAPSMAGGRSPPRSFAELQDCRLLAVPSPADMRLDLWREWSVAAGYPDAVLPEPLLYESGTLMHEAAANGMGVALAVPALSETYLRSGRLRPCFESRAELKASYNLVYATSSVRRRQDVRALTAWLTVEMQASVSTYSSLVAAA
jgi:LysR family glycine cleavage system transcriptional activator